MQTADIPTWIFPVALVLNCYAVIGRESMAAMSLSDMEELLRKQQRTKQVLPRVERFAEKLDSYRFTFLVLALFAKGFAAIGLMAYIGTDATATLVWPSLLVAFAGFLLLTDIPWRPIASAHAEVITLWFMRPWQVTHVVLAPVVLPFKGVFALLDRMMRPADGEREEQAEEDIMASLALGELKGTIEEVEREMIEKILSMDDMTVEEIMTPRTDMHAVDEEDGVEGALKLARESGHSRLPVFRENRDDIIGILYIKDLIGISSGEGVELKKFLRPATFVPGSKRVAHLLAELRKDRVHLAIVLDEYGGTAGLVAFEDLIEVVFGKIADEYDQEEEEDVTQVDEDKFEMDGRIKVAEVNERYDFNLPESESYESLGGLITSELGCIPQVGESWSQPGVVMTVIEATDRRVVKLRLERQEIRPGTAIIENS